MKTLTSLTGSVTKTDIVLIAQCFPFLEELDLDFPKAIDRDTNILPLALPKLRKINISGNCIFLQNCCYIIKASIGFMIGRSEINFNLNLKFRAFGTATPQSMSITL
jgi:F-box/leucine-rich repeat protein 2/20